LHRTGVEETIEHVLSQWEVDLGGRRRSALGAVATGIEDIHLGPVSVRDVSGPAVLYAELPSARQAEVTDANPGGARIGKGVVRSHSKYSLYHPGSRKPAKAWVRRSALWDVPGKEVLAFRR